MNASTHGMARPHGGLQGFAAAVVLALVSAAVLVQAGGDRAPGTDQLAEETALLWRVWTTAQADGSAE